MVEQHLHAHADAKQGLVARGFEHGLAQARIAQLAHAVGHRALAGQHHAGRGTHHVGVGRDHDLPARVLGSRLDGLRDRAQIAHSVIHHGDGICLHIHSYPTEAAAFFVALQPPILTENPWSREWWWPHADRFPAPGARRGQRP
ncbi:hypothetical protein D3C79_851880 [compost metagenome]